MAHSAATCDKAGPLGRNIAVKQESEDRPPADTTSVWSIVQAKPRGGFSSCGPLSFMGIPWTGTSISDMYIFYENKD